MEGSVNRKLPLVIPQPVPDFAIPLVCPYGRIDPSIVKFQIWQFLLSLGVAHGSGSVCKIQEESLAPGL